MSLSETIEWFDEERPTHDRSAYQFGHFDKESRDSFFTKNKHLDQYDPLKQSM
jgi:hypothetical protein